jgi:hypothetical protein
MISPLSHDYCSVKENCRLGFAEPQPNLPREMLGFVPQPNLRSLRFLGKTYAVLGRMPYNRGRENPAPTGFAI